jgi:hypothetical protein
VVLQVVTTLRRVALVVPKVPFLKECLPRWLMALPKCPVVLDILLSTPLWPLRRLRLSLLLKDVVALVFRLEVSRVLKVCQVFLWVVLVVLCQLVVEACLLNSLLNSSSRLVCLPRPQFRRVLVDLTLTSPDSTMLSMLPHLKASRSRCSARPFTLRSRRFTPI